MGSGDYDPIFRSDSSSGRALIRRIKKRRIRATIGRYYQLTLGGKSFLARVRRHDGLPELELLDEHGVQVHMLSRAEITPELLTKFGASA